MTENKESEYTLSPAEKESVARLELVLARMLERRLEIELEIYARIRFVGTDWKESKVGSITVYPAHNIKKQTETIYGIVQQSVRDAMRKLPAHAQTMINGFVVTLKDWRLSGENFLVINLNGKNEILITDYELAK